MNTSKRRATSSYQHQNNDLRSRIVQNTMLQAEPPSTSREKYQTSYQKIFKESDRYSGDSSKVSTDRNMKFKLQQLDSKIEELTSDVRFTRQQTRELLEEVALMKQNLIYEQLYGVKADLDAKITGFSNFVRGVKNSNELRYNQIRTNCNILWEQTQQLRSQMFDLQMRVEAAQRKMGFREQYQML